jgi:hypothetical protein
MIIDATILSKWERCHRIPALVQICVPRQASAREECGRRVDKAVRMAIGGRAAEAGTELLNDFLERAASPGLRYPPSVREVYALAHDYADWVEGGAELVAEQVSAAGPLRQVPMFAFGQHRVNVEGWLDEAGGVHVWRVVDTFPADGDEFPAHWPEMVAQAGTGAALTVHALRLPSVRGGRLASPLVQSYAHPLTGEIRLARIDAEGKGFARTWKRQARWEMAASGERVEWAEWRDGIERDRCLAAITRDYQMAAMEDGERLAIAEDVRSICAMMGDPSRQARKREMCAGCEYEGWCHGNEGTRGDYEMVEAVSAVRAG